MEYRDLWMDYRAFLMECIVDGDGYVLLKGMVMCCCRGWLCVVAGDGYVLLQELCLL